MYSGEFERIGKRLFAEHLVGGNFGNISARKGDEGFFIKRTGAYLDVAGALVFVPLQGDVPQMPQVNIVCTARFTGRQTMKQLYMPIPRMQLLHHLSWMRLFRKTVKGRCSAPEFRLSRVLLVRRRSRIMFPALSPLQNW